jgi:nucleoside 2-deoxyribosyltransferase
MTIYISGPMAGIEGYKKNFKAAEEKMKEAGHEVVNPAEIDGEGMTREELLMLDLWMLEGCDAIHMLKGWQQSCGANREYGFAIAKGMGVMFEEDG